MSSSFLARLAGRVRRSLGTADTVARLAAIEAKVAELGDLKYPHGPVYFGHDTVLVTTRWGAKMLVDTDDAAIAPWLISDGLWEADVTAWMQATLRPNQIFVDVGANVGYFTLLAGKLVGPKGLVVAVEAHPRLAQLLRRNVVINGEHGYVRVINRAAWSSTGPLHFYARSNYAGNSSAGSIGPDSLEWLGDTEEKIEVEGMTLDEMLKDVPWVDVLKIDIEGAEVQALSGMKQTLDANPSLAIIFEWAPAQIESVGDRPEQLVELLSDHGLSFYLLGSDRPIDGSSLLERPYGNIVAKRP